MPRRRLWLTVIAVVCLVAAGCGDGDGGDDDAGATTSSDSESTTTESTDGSSSTTTTANGGSTTSTSDGAAETERCTNPEGFSIDYPADWSTNDGSVTAPCSMFDPEPFTVPDATDERVAAISAFVDPVAFSDVAVSPGGPDHDQATTVVDGDQAVRVSGPEDGNGLYPAGTLSTRYLIDLSLGVDDGPGTLFVDVVDVGDVDFDAATRTLDEMVRTIDLEGDDIEEAEPGTTARYEGGGTPITVIAEADSDGEGTCLRLDTGEAEACVGAVGPDAMITTARLGDDLQPVLAGTAAGDVFRIDATHVDGFVSSFLPSSTGDAPDDGTLGWAFPFGRSDLSELAWFDLDGNELGSRGIEPPGEEGPDPVGAFGTDPVATGDFPASGMPTFLTDVRVGAHEDFDRVVFEFTDDGEAPTYEVELVESPVQQPSGQPLDVGSPIAVRITMTPASRVDLSGTQPEVIYDGPDRITLDATTNIITVALAEDFESSLTWAIGVPDGIGFAVTELSDPRRVVVDVGRATD